MSWAKLNLEIQLFELVLKYWNCVRTKYNSNVFNLEILNLILLLLELVLEILLHFLHLFTLFLKTILQLVDRFETALCCRLLLNELGFECIILLLRYCADLGLCRCLQLSVLFAFTTCFIDSLFVFTVFSAEAKYALL